MVQFPHPPVKSSGSCSGMGIQSGSRSISLCRHMESKMKQSCVDAGTNRTSSALALLCCGLHWLPLGIRWMAQDMIRFPVPCISVMHANCSGASTSLNNRALQIKKIKRLRSENGPELCLLAQCSLPPNVSAGYPSISFHYTLIPVRYPLSSALILKIPAHKTTVISKLGCWLASCTKGLHLCTRNSSTAVCFYKSLVAEVLIRARASRANAASEV